MEVRKLDEKRILTISNYEYNLLLNALNEYRNKLLGEGKSTNNINEVLLKLIDAPLRKKSIFKRERVCER